VLIFAILLLFCGVAVPSIVHAASNGWPMFRHDPSRSGFTTNSAPNGVQSLWNYTTGGPVWSSPAIADGYVVVGSRDGNIFCINQSNGAVLWACQTGSVIAHSSPAIADGCVYIGADNGYFYCIELATNNCLWYTALGDMIRSSAAVVDGKVYVGCNNHNVYCLNASDGTELWVYPTLGVVDSSPAVVDGVVYVGSVDNALYALNASVGSEIWSQHTGGGISSSPNVSGGYVYVGSTDGAVYAFNASDGARIWKFQTQDAIVSSPAVAYGCVYVGSEDNYLYCLDALSGDKIWASSTGYWVWSSPAVADGNVYVGSEDFNIYCFNASTGEQKWSYPTGGAVDSSPAIANGTLYVGCADFVVYALTDSPNASPPITSSNNIAPGVILFDVAALVTAAGVIVGLIFAMRSTMSQKQASKSITQNKPWILTHIDAVCVLTILAFSVVYFVNLGNGPLWTADEQTYSQWAYHMVKTGDYLTPWAFGASAIWMGKPPLVMWLMSLSYQIFGVTNFAARFWSAIFGTLTCVVLFYLGKKLYNPTVGLLSAVVLGTFTTFYSLSKHAMTDIPLLFFMVASIYLVVLSEKPKGGNWYAALSGVCFGLALMTKQLEALLIPLIVLGYLVFSTRSFRFLFTKRFTLFWGMGLLLFSPWLLAMHVNFGSDFWHWFFFYSGVERSFVAIEGHTGSYLYYFSYLIHNENLLWVTLLPFAVALCVYNSAVKRLKADILLLVWMAVVLLVFMFAQTKLYWYIIPVLPAFALAISGFLYKSADAIYLRIKRHFHRTTHQDLQP
jgi:outer membrane protein assembly factor BamB